MESSVSRNPTYRPLAFPMRRFRVYSRGVRTRLWCVLGFALAASAWAQPSGARLPRFEDYTVTEQWPGPANLKLTTRSERMFRTNLTNAAKEPPNFAEHYRVTYWGCGSNCSAGALIDLQTGTVYQLPLAKPNGSGWERWIMCTARF